MCIYESEPLIETDVDFKSCHFCGEINDIRVESDTSTAFVCCGRCLCRGPAVEFDRADCNEMNNYPLVSAMHQAIEHWNNFEKKRIYYSEAKEKVENSVFMNDKKLIKDVYNEIQIFSFLNNKIYASIHKTKEVEHLIEPQVYESHEIVIEV